MPEKSTLKIAATALGAVLFLSIVAGSFYTIDQGERGVILRNGAVIGTADPGLGFKLPIFDRIVAINVQTKARTYDNVLAYSRDQQTAALSVSVNYRLPPGEAETIYSTYGGDEGIVTRLLDRQVYEEVKIVFGHYSAINAIQERSKMVADMQAAVQAAVVGPIVIDSLQVENIDFSDAYENSIEQRMLAEVEVQKVQQNAAREKVQAEIAVIQAQAQADAKLAQAQADAEAIRLRGSAEAEAIRARGDALAKNPALVDLVRAERWDGVLPTTVLPSGAIPFLGVTP